MAHHAYITVEDVRHYILDHGPDDNDVLADLMSDDNEIRQAMVRAARDYNSVPPRAASANPDRLSAHTNMFLDGIVKHLYLAELAKLTRNDMDYSAGGVTANIVQKRIQHLRDLVQYHDREFKEAARNEKYLINLNAGFASF